MKSKKLIYATVAILVVILGCFVVFSEEENQHFENPSEAIKACQKELYKLKKEKFANTSSLIKHINRWTSIRDSSFSCFTHVDSTQMNTEVFNYFYAVSDSIGTEIMRLTASKPKTVEDLLEIQSKTAHNRKKIQKSENFKNASEFFMSLQENNAEVPIDEAIAKYKKLASKTKNIKKEQELLSFIKEENIYFQAIMKNLLKVNIHDLEEISHESERFFSRLMYSLVIDNNEANNRILTYLYMRVNKRVIANTEAVVNIIKSNVKINNTQVVTFRIMLLTPFLSVNAESWAYMTKNEIKVLEDLAPNLHEYLLKIDGVKSIKDKDKAEELKNNIGKYLTTAYVKQLI